VLFVRGSRSTSSRRASRIAHDAPYEHVDEARSAVADRQENGDGARGLHRRLEERPPVMAPRSPRGRDHCRRTRSWASRARGEKHRVLVACPARERAAVGRVEVGLGCEAMASRESPHRREARGSDSSAKTGAPRTTLSAMIRIAAPQRGEARAALRRGAQAPISSRKRKKPPRGRAGRGGAGPDILLFKAIRAENEPRRRARWWDEVVVVARVGRDVKTERVEPGETSHESVRDARQDKRARRARARALRRTQRAWVHEHPHVCDERRRIPAGRGACSNACCIVPPPSGSSWGGDRREHELG